MAFCLERWKGKTAIVTGASAGIGAAIVEKLVEAGVNVVGFARRKERLDELAQKLKPQPGIVHSVRVDMTKENEILEAFIWVGRNLGPVHILVNNAGIVQPTNLMNGDSQMWRNIFDTNVLGLCIATREAIKNMRANNVDGHIIHMNSICGHQVFDYPQMSVYPASKFAVSALAQTLRNELMAAGTKIKITSISPGVVDTELFGANKIDFVLDRTKVDSLEAKDIADAVVYVLSTPAHVEVQELIVRPINTKSF